MPEHTVAKRKVKRKTHKVKVKKRKVKSKWIFSSDVSPSATRQGAVDGKPMCQTEQENIELKEKIARQAALIADLRAKILELLAEARG